MTEINHSFAVMAHGDSPYLPDCLDSLKAQTISSKIYITTSTPSEYLSAIAKRYGIEIFVTEPGLGIAHDWNFSLRQAKTKHVTLAHQDDIYLPEYAKSCIFNSEKSKNTLICFTGYSEIVEKKERSNTTLLRVKRFMLWSLMPIKKNIYSKFWKKLLLSAGCPIPAPSVMYNLENLSGFQFSKEFSINMDWDAWFKIAGMNGRFVYVPTILVKHRIHADSTTTTGLRNNLRQAEDLKMFERFWPKPIAKIISQIYKRSYKSNNMREKVMLLL